VIRTREATPPGQTRIPVGLAGKAAGLPRKAGPAKIGACRMNAPSPPRPEYLPAMMPTVSPTILSATGR